MRTPPRLATLAMIFMLLAIDASAVVNFDVRVEEQYSSVHPGEDIVASVKLLNLGSTSRIDAILEFSITGDAGTEIARKKETVAVETQANFVRTFTIPPGTPPGAYVLHSRIEYPDKTSAVADHGFSVIAAPDPYATLKIAGISAAILAVLGFGLITSAHRIRPALEKMRIRQQVREIIRWRASHPQMQSAKSRTH